MTPQQTEPMADMPPRTWTLTPEIEAHLHLTPILQSFAIAWGLEADAYDTPSRRPSGSFRRGA